MLLAQRKAGNNLQKLKNEIRQTLYLLNQHNKITKKLYNNLIKCIITMVVHNGDNKIIITTEAKTFYFYLPKYVDNDLKYEINFIIKLNELLAERKKKKKERERSGNYCPNISMETIFTNTENSKTNEPHKFVFNLSQRSDLKSSNKHVALQRVSIYYT